MKGLGSTKLPRFVVGALATAGASVASGATVQISFPDNIVTSAGMDAFLLDVTGDGVNDLTRVAAGGGIRELWRQRILVDCESHYNDGVGVFVRERLEADNRSGTYSDHLR